MTRYPKKSQLINQMSTIELAAFRELLESPIAGHIYQANDSTTFRTPVKKLITIVLSTTASRLLVEAGQELRERAARAAKTP
ncbi:hypothetical protein ACFP6B_08590 [Rothia nasimurium]|uniref:hypothetical protein n=1 Tax=Rothia nasimurium TaxID=85336 RepID=UPI003611CB01